ncbi:MAG: hypothetical protein ACYTHJ_09360, partial [Planctomycetota bacterium]
MVPFLVYRVCSLVAVWCAAAPMAHAEGSSVDLSFFPAHRSAEPEDELDLKIWLSTPGQAPVAVVALEAIVTWDPVKLELIGAEETAATATWLSSGFFDDPDGINDPPGVEELANDGQAVFTAVAPIGRPVIASAQGEGAIILRFRVLQDPEFTQIRFAESMGRFAVTRVLGKGVDNDVTGSTSATATIWPTTPVPAMGGWGLMVTALVMITCGSITMMGTGAWNARRR